MESKKHPGVTLRRLCIHDADDLASLANSKKIYDNVRDYFPHPYYKKDAEEFILYCEKENPPVNFGIEYQGRLAGVIGLIMQADIYRRKAEIGYWIGEPFWNKGIASAAVNIMIDYAFEKLRLVRLECGIFESNKASQRVVEKCGFSLEGIFKQSVIKNSEIMNEYRYGLVSPAYK